MTQEKATREELFALFDDLGIAHKTMYHRRVFTVEEGDDIKSQIAGAHSKNLFLKDKNGAFFLICALGETSIKLNQLHKAIGCARLSFGTEDKLWEILGITPGSVTLFALINDKAKRISLILDKALFESELVNFHPLLNDATTTISRDDMLKFVRNWGGFARLADFSHEVATIEVLPLE
ncbi:MAG: DNA-binding protein [Hyphomonadaceae bacterium]|nr:MAG: DNA-binding protein [Hyphomonadaceae bacterium]KAF0187224.1 MAG: DNA-binding protein [Hyphomonadaceae bacterium]